MRRSVFLFFSLTAILSCFGQRDFRLVEDRNFWLTSRNSASLTTFSVPSISEAKIYYDYSKGELRNEMEGRHNNIFGAGAKSLMRLSPKVVVAGGIGYFNNTATDLAGSFLMYDAGMLKPFDLKETTDENAGDKRFECFNIHGAVGWRIIPRLSIGASMDFTAGTYAKFKDLRHTNTLMNLDARLSAFWSLEADSANLGNDMKAYTTQRLVPNYNGIGISFIYKRRTETIKFETFGTTDKVFKTLVDYANGFGEIKTYGGEGFTDSNHETPLYDQYVGLGLQGGLAGLYGEIDYLHRTGYYGKKSQYTVSYSNHSSDIFNWRVRYVLPRRYSYLCMFELNQISELLSSYRTNYRRETLPENSAVTYYEYYEPTKISDKARQKGALSFIGYWKPKGEIYLWHTQASVGYLYSKQTAYIFPYYETRKIRCIIPEIYGRRSFLFANTSLLNVGINLGMQFTNTRHPNAIGQFYDKNSNSGSVQTNISDQIKCGIDLKYEFPLKRTSLRPWVALAYKYNRSLGHSQDDSPRKELSRNAITISLGLTF